MFGELGKTIKGKARRPFHLRGMELHNQRGEEKAIGKDGRRQPPNRIIK